MVTYLVVVVQRWASPYLKASNVGYILPCSASHLEVNFRSFVGVLRGPGLRRRKV